MKTAGALAPRTSPVLSRENSTFMATTTSNPVFSDRVLASAGPVFDIGPTAAGRPTTMTVQGTIGKTALLASILSATAIWSWYELPKGTLSGPFLIGALIGGGILGLLTSFVPRLAPWTSPVYAAFEGLFLGALSKLVDMRFPGLAIQAVALSSGTLFCMLFAYRTGLVRVTDKLRTGIVAGTGAICLVYCALPRGSCTSSACKSPTSTAAGRLASSSAWSSWAWPR